MTTPHMIITLPAWVELCVAEFPARLPDSEARMRLVLELARQNIAFGGGPFAAAVFDSASGELIAPGVNMVLAAGSSVLHAEIVALMLAQQVVGTFDLGASGRPACELVSSCEPCAMCLGAIPWSGVQRLVCGAGDGDARALGFDEGEKPADWIGGLQRRGIAVERDVLRPTAIALLQAYQAAGGPIYNGRGR
ncbi:nucleoside deaminase [Desulfuromonas carbonis]|uniref:nucleoside deaminase n=1 Tax=Desulfuromonas sp. DDH964 TaxID=1823759 RepID=UPI00078B6C1C|nr:nucleoside deaminase [Desulfuromonas sp. DDH964]AMV72874.1 Guanine deaminase [Desulfuromonas sp. DDH964]